MSMCVWEGVGYLCMYVCSNIKMVDAECVQADMA